MASSTPTWSVAVGAALLTLTGCGGGFGLEQDANQWAMACEHVGVLLDDAAPEEAQVSSVTGLSTLLDQYGEGERGKAFRVLVTPVLDGAETDDMEPARSFAAANC